MSYPSGFVHEFLKRLESSNDAGGAAPHSSNRDFPSPDCYDARNRELLVTNSQPESFQLGTGASIFTHFLIPAITSARHEVILVTCFWAPSTTLTALSEALTQVASHRRALIQDALSRGETVIPPLKVPYACRRGRFFKNCYTHNPATATSTRPRHGRRNSACPSPPCLKPAAFSCRSRVSSSSRSV